MHVKEMNPGSTPVGSIEEINPFGGHREKAKYPSTSYRRPPPNLPCGDLLENRDHYLDICIPLYGASIKCDWKYAQMILAQHKDLHQYSISENCDTALHVAASTNNRRITGEFVKNLVYQMTEEQLQLQNKNYNTALCVAAASGSLETAKILVEKNKALLDIQGSEGMMPLYMAALHRKHDMVNYLYDESNKMRSSSWTDQNRGLVLQECVEADIFDVALDIVRSWPELAVNGSVLGVLARKTHAFGVIKPTFLWRALNQFFLVTRLKVGRAVNRSDAVELLDIIWRNIVKLPKDKFDDIMRGPPDVIITKDGKQKTKYSSRVLFVAAEMGNTLFVVQLIRQYPDLLWKTNDNNQTIFHIAVSNRHVGIYNLLYEIGSMKDMIARLKDDEGNNMLHLVGKGAKKNQRSNISGLPQMQHGLLWFKEVASIIPPSYQEKKNKDGLKPIELFIENHKDLISTNEKWMKETANQCLVVAALIASIGFAAAYTVPGGYNQNNGIPMFLGNPSFIVFAISDAISLPFSSISILKFLSIFIADYAEFSFLQSLPQKLMSGILSLFYSITAMLIGFSVSFFLMYKDKLIWVPISISVLISIPVILYAKLLYQLMYGSKNICRAKKQSLDYQNPRF